MPQTAGTEHDSELHRIFDAEADFVYRSLHRLGVFSEDQSDLLQEVFLVVHRRLVDYDRSRPLRAWLFGICLGLVKNHRRKSFRRRELLTDEPPQRVDTANPESLLIASRKQALYRSALDELTPEKRATFVMFEVDGMLAKEIAVILDVPIGTVHSRLSAARQELAAFLERDEEESK